MIENHITDECSSHKYFTQTTNIIFHLGLKAYEIALYMTLKRTAGSRTLSKKGTKRLALESGMSTGQVVLSKEKLCRPLKELNGKSLITIKKTVHESGGNGVDHIFITDIWEENYSFFSDTIKKSSTYSPHEHPYSPHEHPYSPHEPKNNLNRNMYKESIEDDFLKKETLNTKQNTELKAKMEEAGLDNSAINFSKKYSDEKIEIALHKLKQYKPNKPSGYFIGLLKDEDLKQTESKEEIADKNKAKAEEVLKKYRGKKLNGYTIQGDVLSQHFEIGVGGCNGMKVFEYTDNNFDEKLDGYLNSIDVYIES